MVFHVDVHGRLKKVINWRASKKRLLTEKIVGRKKYLNIDRWSHRMKVWSRGYEVVYI